MSNIQSLPFSLIPKNDGELALLKNYHSHLAQQVEQMELHPSHKQDVQKVLLKSLTIVTAHVPLTIEKQKPASIFSQVFHRVFG